MNKQEVSRIRMELSKVLEQFAKDNGLKSVDIGTCRYDSIGFTTKLTVVGDVSEDTVLVDFDKKASMFGLPKGYYGRTLFDGNKKYKVVDVNTRARTLPIIAEDEDGKRYKLRVQQVQMLAI